MESRKVRLLIMVSVVIHIFLLNCLAVYADTTGWVYTAPLPSARYALGAVSANGYMYVFGGLISGGSGITDIDRAPILSDGFLGSWVKVGDLDVPLGRTPAVLAGNYVYLVGGGNNLQTVRRILINQDGSLGTLTVESTQLNIPRVDLGVVYANGYLYAIGGGNPNGRLNSVEYAKVNEDGSVGVWSFTQSMNDVRWLNYAVTANGYVYCIGGTDGSDGHPLQAEFSQITTNGALTPWQLTGNNMPTCYGIPGAAIVGNTIYAYGGWDAYLDDGRDLAEVNINSDGSLQIWTNTGSEMNDRRANFAALAVNNRLYAFGGSWYRQSNGSGIDSSVEVFDLNSTLTPPNGAGNALSFNGVADYVDIPNSSSLSFGTTFTVECWVNAQAINNLNGTAVGKDDGYSRREFIIGVNNAVGTYFQVNETSDSSFNFASAPQINLNTWHQLAGVYDGTNLKLYIDGTLSASTLFSGFNVANTDVPLTIGNWYPGDRSWDGTIDEVRIWNIARSQSQIQSTMNCSLNGNESGLVGYWRLDEGSGQVVYDASGNGNNGELGGSSTPNANDPAWVVSDAPLTCNSTTTTNTQLPFIDFLVASDTGRFVYQVPPSLAIAGQPTISWLPSYNGVSGVLEIIFTAPYQGVNMTLEKSEWFNSDSGQWYLLKANASSNISISNTVSVGGVLYNGVPPGVTDLNADLLISVKPNWALLLGYQESFENNSMYPQLMIRNNNYYPATVYIDYIQVKTIPAPSQ